MTLSSPSGADSKIHDHQPIGDRPVGGVGGFHATVLGEISIRMISMFVRGMSELYMSGWDFVVLG